MSFCNCKAIVSLHCLVTINRNPVKGYFMVSTLSNPLTSLNFKNSASSFIAQNSWNDLQHTLKINSLSIYEQCKSLTTNLSTSCYNCFNWFSFVFCSIFIWTCLKLDNIVKATSAVLEVYIKVWINKKEVLTDILTLTLTQALRT